MQEPVQEKATLPDALYDLQKWDHLSLSECTEIALLVERHLPAAIQFAEIDTYQAGTQQHHLARFTWRSRTEPEPCSFMLIPGSIATLGYDRASQLKPCAELMYEWWNPDADKGEIQVAVNEEPFRSLLPSLYDQLHQQMDTVLSPLRTASIQPYLLEVAARPASHLIARVVGKYHRKHVWSRQGQQYVSKSWGGWPPEFPPSVAAWLIGQAGFRFPTSDEWEYACAAGSRTLFYWGNNPFNGSEHEWDFTHARTTKAVTHHGDHSYPHPYTSYIDAPLNAFGLAMATDPYLCEWCAEAEIMRGGDGGFTSCGGLGRLAVTLPFASSYIMPTGNNERYRVGASYPRYVRRLYDLVRLPE